VTFQYENVIMPFIYKGIKQKTTLSFPVVLCGSEMRFVTVSGDRLQALWNRAQKNILKLSGVNEAVLVILGVMYRGHVVVLGQWNERDYCDELDV
jgi:hypothetical protein